MCRPIIFCCHCCYAPVCTPLLYRMSIPLQLTLGNTALVWVKALYEHVHVPLHILIENKTTGAPKCIDHFQQIVISWVDLFMILNLLIYSILKKMRNNICTIFSHDKIEGNTILSFRNINFQPQNKNSKLVKYNYTFFFSIKEGMGKIFSNITCYIIYLNRRPRKFIICV